MIKGIDVAQLEGFNKQYADSPSSFTLGIEARTIWEGEGLGNLARIGPWQLGGNTIEKPTRDFSVQLGSWKEVGDAIGVLGADDRIEPVESALAALCSCVTEAVTLNCARTGVHLEGLEVKAHLDVDPGPIVGVKDPSEWEKTLKTVDLEVAVRGNLSAQDKTMVEEGAGRSPIRHLFGRALDVRTKFSYEK